MTSRAPPASPMRRPSAVLAWVLAGTALLAAAASLLLARRNGGELGVVGLALPFLTFAGVGAVVASRSPVRTPVQRAVDRRFRRVRFHVQQTFEGFAHHLRDEVVLDALRPDLIGVALMTIRPAQVSPRPAAREHRP